MNTANSHVPAPPLTDGQVLFHLVIDVLVGAFTGLWWLCRYWVRRTREDWRVGLLYVVVWGSAGGLLILNALQAAAYTFHEAYYPVPRLWLLDGRTWDPPVLVGLVVLMGAAVFVDRALAAAAARAAEAALPPPAPPPPPAWDQLVLGQRYRRWWDPAQADWALTPQATFVTVGTEILKLNGLAIGPQGSGKTLSLLLPLLRRQLRAGGSVLVVDRKGDGFPADCFSHHFDLLDPAHSFAWNIWGLDPPATAAELLAEALVPLPVESDAAGYYYAKFCRTALSVLVRAHVETTAVETPAARVGGCFPTLRELYDYLQSSASRKQLAARLPESSPLCKELAALESRARDMRDGFGSLQDELYPIVQHPIARRLVGPEAGVALRDLVNTRAVALHLALYHERHPQVAPFLARLALVQFDQAVHPPAVRPDFLKLALVDDADQYLSPHILQCLPTSRQYLGAYFFGFQSLEQVPLGFRHMLLGLCGLVAVWHGVDAETATLLEATFGEAYLPLAQEDVTTSQGTATGATTGVTAQHPAGWGGGPASAGRQQGQTYTASTATSTTRLHRRERRSFWARGELQTLPLHHAVIWINRSTPDPDPALRPPTTVSDVTLVNLDRAVLDPVEQAQDQAPRRRPPGGPPPRLDQAPATYAAIVAALRTTSAAWLALLPLPLRTPLQDLELAAHAATLDVLVARLAHHCTPDAERAAAVARATAAATHAVAAWGTAQAALAAPAAGDPSAPPDSPPAGGAQDSDSPPAALPPVPPAPLAQVAPVIAAAPAGPPPAALPPTASAPGPSVAVPAPAPIGVPAPAAPAAATGPEPEEGPAEIGAAPAESAPAAPPARPAPRRKRIPATLGDF